MKQLTVYQPTEFSTRVAFCGDKAVEIEGRRYEPDRYTAYVEFRLAHAFPVVTVDQTALHPQVVANSYATMRNKVFNLGHIMKAYSPDNRRDRVLGTIVGVEFPPVPYNGWRVQGRRELAPGIRAVAAVHKQAEGADAVIGQHLSGRRRWTVSMENEFYVDTGGFAVRAPDLFDTTPEDFRALGWSYVPYAQAPNDLLACFNSDTVSITQPWKKRAVVFMPGGLSGEVFFKGTGLTPLGKEKEAEIVQMLASADCSCLLDDLPDTPRNRGLAALSATFTTLLDAVRNHHRLPVRPHLIGSQK